MRIFKVIPILLFLGLHTVTGQAPSPSQAFDRIVRLENTDLALGIEYIEQHNTRNNKHKFFLTEAYTIGQVVYDGQRFNDVSLKYNIFDDLLFVKMDNSGGESSFQLFENQVMEFSLADHRFLNLGLPAQEKRIQGFHEVLLENPQGFLLKKHRKERRTKLDRDHIYYEFKSRSPQFGFYQNNHYYPIDSRTDVQDLYPEKEKEIRQYYRSHRKLRKTNPDRFLADLFNTLYHLDSQR